MKRFIILVATTLPFNLQAEQECSFDQDNQVAVIAAIVKKFHGGKVNFDQRQVVWSVPTEGITTFAFGGCEDFGSTVTRSTHLPKSRTRKQVFGLAHELSVRFWSDQPVSERLATDALTDAIQHARYIEEHDGNRTTFNVKHPGFVRLYIEHEYANGVDRVVIGWQGAF